MLQAAAAVPRRRGLIYKSCFRPFVDRAGAAAGAGMIEPAHIESTRDRMIALALFGFCAAIYALCTVSFHSDMVWAIHTALSLLRGQWGDLSTVPNIDPTHYSLVRVGDRLYMLFPIGTSLMIAPAVALLGVVAPGWLAHIEQVNPPSGHRMFAAIICALAVAFFYRALRERFARDVAVVAALILAFATGMWSTASRGLWSHGPLILCYAVALLMILRAERRPMLAALAGLPLGFAILVRPTAALALAAFAAVVAIRWPRRAIGFALCAAAILGPWVTYNLAIYGAPIPPYYRPSRLAGTRTFGEALLGHLVSPSRGLFVFSPVLLLLFPGLALALRGARDRLLAVALGAVILGHWIGAARFAHWWGGASFGPRLMIDILPFAVFLGAYAQEGVMAMAPRARGLAAGAVALLALASAAINAQGALSGASIRWNVIPTNVDRAPARVWDWHDPQVFSSLREWRGLRDRP